MLDSVGNIAVAFQRKPSNTFSYRPFLVHWLVFVVCCSKYETTSRKHLVRTHIRIVHKVLRVCIRKSCTGGKVIPIKVPFEFTGIQAILSVWLQLEYSLIFVVCVIACTVNNITATLKIRSLPCLLQLQYHIYSDPYISPGVRVKLVYDLFAILSH